MSADRRYCARCRVDITYHPLPRRDTRGLLYCGNCKPLAPHEHVVVDDPDEVVCDECRVCLLPSQAKPLLDRHLCHSCYVKATAPRVEVEAIDLMEICDACQKPVPPAAVDHIDGKTFCPDCRAAAARVAAKPKPAPAPIIAPIGSQSATVNSGKSSISVALNPAEQVEFVPDASHTTNSGTASPAKSKPVPPPKA